MSQSYVLITGATSGIGYELAKEFAFHHHNLIITGRNKEKMDEIKKYLEEVYDINVQTILCHLDKSHAAHELYEMISEKGLEVEVLINNAGAGYVGEFCDEPIEKDESLITLNMTSVTALTKYFGKVMKKRGRGKILNVASTGAYHPGSYTSVYYATKAYVLSFTEAISKELKPYGVQVSVLCPGATKTNFSRRAGRADSGIAMSAEYVAKYTYKALKKNKLYIVPGLKNKLFIRLPRQIAGKCVASYQKKLMYRK